MTGRPARAAISRTRSAWRRAASRDSMTHGPAISASGAPPPTVTVPTRTPRATSVSPPSSRRAAAPRAGGAGLEGRLDEALEERVALHRPRLELGVKLARDEPGMVAELDHLDQRAVGGDAGEHEPALLEPLAIGVVHLVAVAVALGDLLAIVEPARQRAFLDHGV